MEVKKSDLVHPRNQLFKVASAGRWLAWFVIYRVPRTLVLCVCGSGLPVVLIHGNLRLESGRANFSMAPFFRCRGTFKGTQLMYETRQRVESRSHFKHHAHTIAHADLVSMSA